MAGAQIRNLMARKAGKNTAEEAAGEWAAATLSGAAAATGAAAAGAAAAAAAAVGALVNTEAQAVGAAVSCRKSLKKLEVEQQGVYAASPWASRGNIHTASIARGSATVLRLHPQRWPYVSGARQRPSSRPTAFPTAEAPLHPAALSTATPPQLPCDLVRVSSKTAPLPFCGLVHEDDAPLNRPRPRRRRQPHISPVVAPHGDVDHGSGPRGHPQPRPWRRPTLPSRGLVLEDAPSAERRPYLWWWSRSLFANSSVAMVHTADSRACPRRPHGHSPGLSE